MARGMKKGMFPFQLTGFLLVLSAAGWFSGRWTGYGYLVMALAILFLVTRLWFWFKRGRHGAKSHISRQERKQERSDGTMSRYDHMVTFSRTRMRLKWARELQPHRDDLGMGTFKAWLRNPITETQGWATIMYEPVDNYASKLGVSNLGWKFLQHNAHVLRISGPRSGKSEGLNHRIIEHRGPVIATSTRAELVHVTRELRYRVGMTYVFNVGGVGNLPSDLRWSILAGCKDMRVAMRRARDLYGPIQQNTERGAWDVKAVNVLGPLLYLAAHLGYGIQAVEAWSSPGSMDESRKMFFEHIQPNLMRIKDTAARLSLGGLETFYATNDRTRTSITSSLTPVLAWIKDENMNDLGNAKVGSFDVVRQILDANATVYILGGGEEADPSAPLMRALVAEIVYQARREAERRPGGRLTPALLLALDEVPLTCPGPIDKWVADMGGRGIVLDMVAQARSQLDDLWGQAGRSIIMAGCHVVLYGSGINDRGTIEDFSLLAGTRTEMRNSYDANGKLTSKAETEVPVVDPGKATSLREGDYIFFCRGRIDIIKTPRAKKRRDYLNLQKAKRKAAKAGQKEPMPKPFSDRAYLGQDEAENWYAEEQQEARK